MGQQLCPHLPWENAVVNEGGQFHTVLLGNDQAVIRTARTPEASAQMPRSVRLHRLVAEQLDYRIPTDCSEILTVDGLSSVATVFIPGGAHEPHHGDPLQLRRVVKELASVQLSPLESELAEPFSFRGPWTPARQQACFDALPAALRPATTALWDQLDYLAQVPAGLVHGDLAGHNMHWVDGQLLGILDWDLACAWDPALNTAYLSLWHGQEMIEQIAPDAEQARRARIWLGLMSLERLSDTLTRSDNPRLDKLMRKIGPRILAAAAAVASPAR